MFETCSVEVYLQPWTKTKELLNSSCKENEYNEV